MKKLLFLVLFFPGFAFALITGPSTTTTSTFTLSYTDGYSITLRETDATGANVLHTWTSSPVSLTKTDGVYFFTEKWCDNLPFAGRLCFAVDTHQVSVNTSGSPTPSYPESLKRQADYNFQFRTADFNGDGRIDVYVKRLQPGPIDGSMQSYIIWNGAGGVLSIGKLTSLYASAAERAPVNSLLNLMTSDINADGYADHIIEHLDTVLGRGVIAQYAVFAPATATDKTKPLGGTSIDQQFKSFFADLGQWMNDPDYFADNIRTVVIPVYAVGFYCSFGSWGYSQFGLRGRSCYPYVYRVGFRTVRYGVNFSALSASTKLDALFDSRGNISNNNLWQLSLHMKTVLGVHSFGYNDSGIRGVINYDGINDAVDTFIYFIASWTRSTLVQSPENTHDYTVETTICNTSETNCTLANIACWGRHYHAPREDGDYSKAVTNGAVVDLVDVPAKFENEIHTGVGAAAGLAPNAIANVTRPNHILHDDNGPNWPTCPKPVASQGAGPVNNCSQVYREPYITNGRIAMRTRGFGDNVFPWINEREGKRIFEELDEAMIEAIENAPDGQCPSL